MGLIRMMAIVERELRRFVRSPALMMASMVFPLVQLIVLGNAFGGKIHDARLGVVDLDRGTQALRVREGVQRPEVATIRRDRQRRGAPLAARIGPAERLRMERLAREIR